MATTQIEELLSRIQDEILKRAGKGFTLETSAEITKFETFKRVAPSLFSCIISDGSWTWKFCGTDANQKYISKFQRKKDDALYFDRIDCVDLDVDISPEVEKQLPEGVIIHKTSPVVLYDGREFVPNILSNGTMMHIRRLKENQLYGTEKNGRKADYIEGRRVYITVTDEYATQLFNKVCDSEYPFVKLLLTKYDHILKGIVKKWGCSRRFAHEINFKISCSAISLRGAYEGDGYGYDWDTIQFRTLGMRDLSSDEQLYGMAIAIIDTIKAENSELSQAVYKIKREKETVYVCGIVPDLIKVETAAELKEW